MLSHCMEILYKCRHRTNLAYTSNHMTKIFLRTLNWNMWKILQETWLECSWSGPLSDTCMYVCHSKFQDGWHHRVNIRKDIKFCCCSVSSPISTLLFKWHFKVIILGKCDNDISFSYITVWLVDKLWMWKRPDWDPFAIDRN